MEIYKTAEHVSDGHPDKFCDQVADAILDEIYALCTDLDERRAARTAIECLAKDRLLVVSGEVRLPPHVKAQLDIVEIARGVWSRIGYGDPESLTVLDHVRAQSAQIAGEDATVGVDAGGAGDQGIMVGYATDETPSFMPLEYELARDILVRLRDLRREGTLDWLRADAKSQVTVGPDRTVSSVIVAAQHSESMRDHQAAVKMAIYERAIVPVLAGYGCSVPDPGQVKVNGCGPFTIGGPTGDAGVVGRKIVVDAYGPSVAVGGGAYSGKDPTKVDRSAAYMARHIAKTTVARGLGGAHEATVRLAYGIGQVAPEMFTVTAGDGRDLTALVRPVFEDLSPRAIIESLQLHSPEGWSYFDVASFGHYGIDRYPWERVR